MIDFDECSAVRNRSFTFRQTGGQAVLDCQSKARKSANSLEEARAQDRDQVFFNSSSQEAREVADQVTAVLRSVQAGGTRLSRLDNTPTDRNFNSGEVVVTQMPVEKQSLWSTLTGHRPLPGGDPSRAHEFEFVFAGQVQSSDGAAPAGSLFPQWDSLTLNQSRKPSENYDGQEHKFLSDCSSITVSHDGPEEHITYDNARGTLNIFPKSDGTLRVTQEHKFNDLRPELRDGILSD